MPDEIKITKLEITKLVPEKEEQTISQVIEKRKKKLKKRAILFIIVLFITTATAAALFVLLKQANNSQNNLPDENATTTVKTFFLNQGNKPTTAISTIGVIKPSAQIEVISLASGKARQVNFKIGDFVAAGDILVELSDENAQKSLQSAQIALETAQDNLENVKILQIKNAADAKNNALVSANNYLNTINNALDQINYIIKAEGSIQLPDIAPVLAAKDQNSLVKAKENYLLAGETHKALRSTKLSAQNIENELGKIIINLNQTRKAVDQTIIVLDNTVTSFQFSSAALTAQKNAFSALKNAVIAAETTAEIQLQSLQNISLLNKRELDVLENNLKLNQSQLELAQIVFNNLNIKAPISGRITAKYIETEEEVSRNQSISQISQTYNLKIELSLTQEDVLSIKIGQKAIINKNLPGAVASIAPTADPITKKVKVEILVNNANGLLIAETFADVQIPDTAVQKTSPNSAFIPLKALFINQNENFVFTVENNQALKKNVVVGQTQNNLIEILEGLSQNDQIIIEGGKNLKNGQPVQIIN